METKTKVAAGAGVAVAAGLIGALVGLSGGAVKKEKPTAAPVIADSRPIVPFIDARNPDAGVVCSKTFQHVRAKSIKSCGRGQCLCTSGACSSACE